MAYSQSVSIINKTIVNPPYLLTKMPVQGRSPVFRSRHTHSGGKPMRVSTALITIGVVS